MDTKNLILRTKFIDRMCHWTMVACFFLVAMSGLSWFFPSLSWMNGVLGTPQLARMLHPFLGTVVFVLLICMFFRFVHHNMPVRTDVTWFRNIVDVLMNRHTKPLKIGKYNAGQKILFWCIMLLISALFATGIVAWRPYFAGYFPIPAIRLALLAHSLAGLGLILLVIGHIYMGIWVRGSVTGMLTGYVSRAWAKQHHDRWYEEEVAPSKDTPAKHHS
ncbi:formate dehydrogenase subunit gamma [Acetobacter persici]|uniref:formate dehydrogenase subunit gamma n=1 Tax=Acetobacter TaxID=434 RepID=UPI001BAC5B51|nr:MULTISPECIES: formate dehydrogenase subunit gamma [Acetobacter]MBS1001893.1 formate dehydrogenase subunit gamma [Acetobacter persici]